jgi:hypothetical protein
MDEQAMVHPGSLLIAGLPATGKSTFGDWLEQHAGYFHLDFDEEPLVQQRGFGREQQLLWKHHQTEPLVEALQARHQPIALTWGFAPKFLPLVERLFAHGFAPVWFAADPAVSRRAFVARGGIDVKYFDQFLAPLLPIESEIIRVFRGQVLRALRDDGTHLPPSTIFTQLQAWLI